MIIGRYLAILPRDAGDARYWRARLAAAAGHTARLEPTVDCDDLIVLTTSVPLSLHNESGVILGHLIAAGDDAPRTRLDNAEASAIAAEGADKLFRDYWGPYVALLRHAPGDIRVLRAPLGELPALLWQSSRGVLAASDIELLTSIGGYAPSIDWTGVAEHLVAADLRRPRTCLADVTELNGGCEARWSGGRWHIGVKWTPWRAVPPRFPSLEAREAGERLGNVIRTAVRARMTGIARAVLLLSGGLDSSLVAATLKLTGHNVDALNLVTRDTGGDERRYADAVAQALRIELTTVIRDPLWVDITRSLAQGLPRPIERSFAQATHAAACELAERIGAQAVLHGGGGDNIFCSLQSVAPVADRLLAHGPDPGFWKTAGAIAALAEASLFEVVAKAGLRALQRRRPFRFVGDASFLTAGAIAIGAAAREHPWFVRPSGSLPGSAAHIGLIASAQSVVESTDPRRAIPWIAPLLAQPIVEACVAIPSWNWYANGCNRAVARHAVARQLPDAIAWRRSKGAMDSFIVEIFEQNRASLSEWLVDGELASRGIIDRAAVKAELADRGPTRGTAYARLMQLADVEAWARSW
ncbi:asparagine synthase-related protein [Sphingomonas sp.]|uniref:asparagine synthase-related protein n=1 Tax=Sphingomonas sp. TaxID=28214 RepID=UPI0031D6DB1E